MRKDRETDDRWTRYTRREFMKSAVVKGGMAVGIAAIGVQAARFINYLSPEKRFMEDWKGVVPVREEDGVLTLRGKPIAPETLRRSIQRGAELIFMWADHIHEGGNLISGKLVVDAAGVLRAFSNKCTHEGCAVIYHENYRGHPEVIWSHCHDGSFDPQTGTVWGGPPPRPLQIFEVVEKGETVYLKPKPKWV